MRARALFAVGCLFVLGSWGFCGEDSLESRLAPLAKAHKGKVAIAVRHMLTGESYTLNGDQAKKVVDQLRPRLYVLPMHYGVPGYDDIQGPEEFLGEFDKKYVRKTPETNELVIPVDAKTPEHFTVVQLGWKKGDAPPKK